MVRRMPDGHRDLIPAKIAPYILSGALRPIRCNDLASTI
jgi:hypothetical protein